MNKTLFTNFFFTFTIIFVSFYPNIQKSVWCGGRTQIIKDLVTILDPSFPGNDFRSWISCLYVAYYHDPLIFLSQLSDSVNEGREKAIVETNYFVIGLSRPSFTNRWIECLIAWLVDPILTPKYDSNRIVRANSGFKQQQSIGLCPIASKSYCVTD